MEQPFFSVIIPFFDEALYIRETISSVLKQQYRNFEVVCINDESTDDSVKVLQQTAAGDTRVKIINVHHSGKCVARNIGIRNSSAPWICFLNAGDIYYENHLRVMYQFILDNPLYSGFSTELLNGSNYFHFDKKNFFRDKREISLADIDDFTPLSLNQFCFRKEDVLQTLFPSMKLPVSEDLLFVRQFLLSKPILKISLVTTVANMKPRFEKNSLPPAEKILWHKLATDILLNNFVKSKRLKSILRIKTSIKCAKMYLQQKMYAKAIAHFLRSITWIPFFPFIL